VHGESVEGAESPRDDVCVLDVDALVGPLVARSRRAGDRMLLHGLDGHTSVKRLLIARRVPRALRAEYPVVVDGMLYATTPTLKVIALDAATGREIWKFDPGGGAGTGGRFRHRGVTVHRDRVFVLNGHEYVVIACGGGKNGAPSGSTIVAFALP